MHRIAKKSGGASIDMAGFLVRSVLQPLLVYRAQFDHITKTKWSRLGVNNQEATLAITALPRHSTADPTDRVRAQFYL